MELSKETSISEIVDFLQEIHFFSYRTASVRDPLKIIHKTSGFGTHVFVVQNNQTLASIKCVGEGENLIVGRKNLEQALEQMGYTVSH